MLFTYAPMANVPVNEAFHILWRSDGQTVARHRSRQIKML